MTVVKANCHVASMMVCQSLALLTWFAAVAQAAVAAQDPDEEDLKLQPGLLASYNLSDGLPSAQRGSATALSGRAALRVDPDIQFNWEAASPDLRLPSGGFHTAWRGTLWVPAEGKYVFHLYTCGRARLRLAGRTLLEGQTPKAAWLSTSRVELPQGYRPLEVDFTRTGSLGRIGFYWESSDFALEPVAARWLFHERSADVPADLFAQGHSLVRAYGCSACHALLGIEKRKAPSLAGLASHVEVDWLVRWLQSPHAVRPAARMPEFGLDAEDARAIASYLLAAGGSKDASAQPSARQVAGSVSAGEELFRTLGCLACHRPAGLDNASLFGGGSLDGIGDKRSLGDLRLWLTRPEVLNPDHRMPVFDLRPQEVEDLAAYLASRRGLRGQATALVDPPLDGLKARGKQLIEQHRCAACHAIPGVTAPSPVPIQQWTKKRDRSEAPALGWERSCLGRPDAERTRPGYHFDATEAAAVRTLLANLPANVAPQSRFEWGRRLVRENCLGCHARDLAPGLLPSADAQNGREKREGQWAARRGELEPPALTSAGDKFHEPALRELIQGGLPPRRSWLKVRMPRFNHGADERDALVSFLTDHDRIPPRPETADSASANAGQPGNLPSAEMLTAAQRLVSAQGFSCMSCHALGKHAPKGIEPGARGSDLLGVDRRLRREWFLRWVKDPARIVAGMEMPSIIVPVRGVLDERLDAQLEALWQGLNSEAFVVPSDRDWTVQVLAPRAGDRPVVLRDVMFDAPPGSGWCPRALAVGLPNRHNVLFDLETMSLRSWWLGDFARQRTEGKTWLWEPAGLPLSTRVAGLAGLALRDRNTGEILLPQQEGQTVGWLKYWEHADGAVRFAYRLRFPQERWVQVSETIRPETHGGEPGFAREIAADGVPPDLEPLVIHATDETASAVGGVLAQSGPLGPFGIDGPEGSAWAVLRHERAGANGETWYGLGLTRQPHPDGSDGPSYRVRLAYHTAAAPAIAGSPPPEAAAPRTPPANLSVVPGHEAVRLPLDGSVMPTAIAFQTDGTPLVCSLKGQVFAAKDTDGDGLEDAWRPFSDHLAAPFGVLADGGAVFVSHKPELLRLTDDDGDGFAERTDVVATGWGYTEDYHDWTFGLVRDSQGSFYATLGSDYQQASRPQAARHLRGHALRITPAGAIEDLAGGLRFAAGITIRDDDQVFVTDNQGVQNTFNEINHLIAGSRYGVPALADAPAGRGGPRERPAAIQIPHPLTRSVNGICFLPARARASRGQAGANEGQAARRGSPDPFAGHGIGCEYDTRALIRFTLQSVGDTFQGACYPFSLPGSLPSASTPDADRFLLGPICCGASPTGDLYVGGMRESGWGGGNNVGELVRLRPRPYLPTGIREVRAWKRGFIVEFTGSVEPAAVAQATSYSISSYRRIWQGTYATPDSDRQSEEIREAALAPDGRSVVLTLARMREGFVYDIHVTVPAQAGSPLWPAQAHYTLNAVPSPPAP